MELKLIKEGLSKKCPSQPFLGSSRNTSPPLSNHIPFPYLTNQNLVVISWNCSRFCKIAYHSTSYIIQSKWHLSVLNIHNFFLVASKFEIIVFFKHAPEESYKWSPKRGKDVLVNLPTSYRKSVIYMQEALPTIFDALQLSLAGHLILCDGAISHNWPQIASDRQLSKNCIIHKKSHNS